MFKCEFYVRAEDLVGFLSREKEVTSLCIEAWADHDGLEGGDQVDNLIGCRTPTGLVDDLGIGKAMTVVKIRITIEEIEKPTKVRVIVEETE